MLAGLAAEVDPLDQVCASCIIDDVIYIDPSCGHRFHHLVVLPSPTAQFRGRCAELLVSSSSFLLPSLLHILPSTSCCPLIEYPVLYNVPVALFYLPRGLCSFHQTHLPERWSVKATWHRFRLRTGPFQNHRGVLTQHSLSQRTRRSSMPHGAGRADGGISF